MDDSETQDRAQHVPGKAKVYGRFAAMVGVATIIMYFLMYLNTYRWDHVFFSETRTYMALLMGTVMAIVMLSFMLKMHPDRRINVGIYIGSAVLFALALWLVRSQRTVEDVSYMKAMIPHHSIAILTSTRAEISDPRVRKLADEIIQSQRREIAEMKVLIADIEANGKQTSSGVVGLDNYKMGWLPDHPKFHDVPAHDIHLVGRTLATAAPLKGRKQKVQTSAFHPFAKAAAQGAIVNGETKEQHGDSHNEDAGGHGGGKGESMTAGPRRPMDVRFSPEGDALYIADSGTMVVEDKPLPVPGTGVIWRVIPAGAQPALPAGLTVPR